MSLAVLAAQHVGCYEAVDDCINCQLDEGVVMPMKRVRIKK